MCEQDKEFAMQQGMAHGIEAYNEAIGSPHTEELEPEESFVSAICVICGKIVPSDRIPKTPDEDGPYCSDECARPQCEYCDDPIAGEPVKDAEGRNFCCDDCMYEAEDATKVGIELDRERGMEDGDLIDGVGFADPGGKSALRAATPENPRNLPCPTCGEPNRLTPADRAAHYQCDQCADRAEGGGY